MLAALVLPSTAWLAAFLALSWSAIVAARLVVFGPISEVDAVFVVWLAASQNVLLALGVTDLSADSVRLLIGVNFLMGALWLGALSIQRVQSVLRLSTVWVPLGLGLLASLTAGSVAIFGFNGMAALASTRNIMTPLLFFAVGWLIGMGRDDRAGRRFMGALTAMGVGVLALGIIERYWLPDLWSTLHVGVLWTKKGLTNVGPQGVPRNWWSAEQIAGAPVRRLVSTFADPVNLGTFLTLVMVCAYGLRRYVVVVLAAVGIALTVSKGGALGFLIFAVVYAYYRWFPLGFIVAGLVATAAGVAFIAYSVRYASGSLFAHLGGAAFAMLGLRYYPFGRGIGQAGTMAQQFADLGPQQITESGLGVIVGQLGLPGILIYGVFMLLVYRNILPIRSVRDRIVAVTLFWSINANIIFNEVALSPNSCAGYFVILGLMAANTSLSQRSLRVRQATTA